MDKFKILCLLTCLLCFQSVIAKELTNSVQDQLRNLESTSGGTLGISSINLGNSQRIQYRAQERFPMGCTSKVVAVGAILRASMNNRTLLQDRIYYNKTDLTNWTPITEKHLSDGLTVEELSAAAISYSDNTAMNLLAKKLGGLQKINEFAHSINDTAFRLNHDWPAEAMSSRRSGQDSSTPAEMEQTLQKLTLGNVLDPAQRDKLTTWLKQNTTGNKRIRAGVPKGWEVGDKTGTSFHYGSTNDIAIIWPPKCAPIVVAMFYSGNNKDAPKREDVLASATRILINNFAANDKCLSHAI